MIQFVLYYGFYFTLGVHIIEDFTTYTNIYLIDLFIYLQQD